MLISNKEFDKTIRTFHSTLRLIVFAFCHRRMFFLQTNVFVNIYWFDLPSGYLLQSTSDRQISRQSDALTMDNKPQATNC